MVKLFHNEQGHRSAARAHLCAWTVFAMVLIGRHWRELPQHIVAVIGTIHMALIAWAAGPRIAQYLAPGISGLAAQAKAVWARRDPKEGVDPA